MLIPSPQRKRRVKCDEGKPICRRCVTSGHTCVGYELPDAAPITIMTSSPLWWRAHPSAGAPPPAELELSSYFRQRLVTSGHDEFSLDLWRALVPQAADSQAAMWHATNTAAAIALYRAHSAEPGMQDVAAAQYQQGLRQYSLSLRRILDMIESGRTLTLEEQTAILLANCLLGHCCLLYGDYIGVVAFWSYSNRLMHQWKFWRHVNKGPAALYASYVMIQIIKVEGMFREHRAAVGVDEVPEWTEALADVQQRPASSITDLYTELEMIWATLRGALLALPLKPSAEELTDAEATRVALRRFFACWTTRYDDFETTAPGEVRALDPSIDRALGMRRILIGVLLAVKLSPPGECWDDTCWDAFETNFRQALVVADGAAACHYPARGDEQVQREQTSEKSSKADAALPRPFSALLWKCLHFIACVCRHPTVRRTAADMLQKRLYSNWVQGRAPRSLMGEIFALEESAWATCGNCVEGTFVCNEHRVVRIVARQAAPDVTERTLFTVGDLLHRRAGYKFCTSTSVWC